MDELQKNLKYQFKNIKLLEQALTHSSVTRNEQRNYERLEFLGDRVLGLTMAHLLYMMFPKDKEGVLAQRHVKLVRAEAVAEVVRRLGIDKYLNCQDELSRQSVNVLCDIGEAVIGAIYIDSNIEQAIAFVERNWRDLIDKDTGSQKDAKSILQEKFHAMKLPSPTYEVIAKEGTEHEPLFTVRVKLNEKIFADGSGQNKKTAEQVAAKKLLKLSEQEKIW